MKIMPPTAAIIAKVWPADQEVPAQAGEPECETKSLSLGQACAAALRAPEDTLKVVGWIDMAQFDTRTNLCLQDLFTLHCMVTESLPIIQHQQLLFGLLAKHQIQGTAT